MCVCHKHTVVGNRQAFHMNGVPKKESYLCCRSVDLRHNYGDPQ